VIFAIDFDGTIARAGDNGLELRPGAADALRALRAAGHTLVLHSTRLTQPTHLTDQTVVARLTPSLLDADLQQQEMERFLRRCGLWTVASGGVFDLVWDRPGKPVADRYIDDRSMRPVWEEVERAFGR